jgi:hypothetical protein
MTHPFLRPLAWLLALANAGAGGIMYRRDFYALKDRLLRRYGRVVGEDVQRIVDECWGYDQEGCKGKGCRRCRGTGIWRDRLILLERWELGDRVFHRPVREIYGAHCATIVGRITHRDVHARTSAEALLWLTLLFDRRLFWRVLSSSRYCGWQWRPMLALQVVAFAVRVNIWRFTPRRCGRCGRRFIRPFDRRSWWLQCRRCAPSRMRRVALSTEVADDLPF